jgi:serine/threonine protein kinase
MLNPGTIIQNRYRLEYQLNDNPNRQSWFAEDLETQEQVIVKLLALGGAVQWDDLKLFEREAQVLKQLDHPKIPKCRDYFSIDDRTLWFGLVQQYIPGISLKQRLNQGQNFTEVEIYEIITQILDILEFLHQFNPPILHRDLKPSNLILGEDNQIYLIDFGAVQAKPNATGRTFTVVGTYGYTPLEQFGGQAVPASDLYALGATIIELLTGISPSNLPQKDLKIQFREQITNNIDPHLINWIDRLIEPSLERRLKNVAEARKSLEDKNYQIIQESILDTLVRLEKFPEYLNIFIPSSFEIEIVNPLKKWVNQKINNCREYVNNLKNKYLKLTKKKRHKLIRETLIAILFFIVVDVLGSGFLTHFIGQILGYIMSIILTILPIFVILFFIAWWIFLSVHKADYYETIQLYFTTTYLEFNRYSSSNTRKERVDLNQIKEVYLSRFTNANGVNYPSIVITIEGNINAWSLSTRDRSFVFGHQLTETELTWLIEEIKTWISRESW